MRCARREKDKNIDKTKLQNHCAFSLVQTSSWRSTAPSGPNPPPAPPQTLSPSTKTPTWDSGTSPSALAGVSTSVWANVCSPLCLLYLIPQGAMWEDCWVLIPIQQSMIWRCRMDLGLNCRRRRSRFIVDSDSDVSITLYQISFICAYMFYHASVRLFILWCLVCLPPNLKHSLSITFEGTSLVALSVTKLLGLSI